MSILDTYGYKDSAIHLTTRRQQDEEKQSEIDEEQSERIQRNTDVNDEQESQINELNEKIKHMSGGTVTDFDFGSW